MSESLPSAAIVSDDRLARKHTDWAAFNTRFAAERTLMAAVRTSLSLISFGFTIYKFFEAMGESSPLHVKGPRRLGLTLVVIGILVLVAGGWQYVGFMKALKSESGIEFPWSISLGAATLLALTGLVVFVVILIRW